MKELKSLCSKYLTMITMTKHTPLLLLSLIFATSPAMAQRISLPPRPVHLSLGFPFQQLIPAYTNISVDIKVRKLRPMLGYYLDNLDHINKDRNYIYAADASHPRQYTNTLNTFKGRGLTATWDTHQNFRVGLGLGKYIVDHDYPTKQKGLGGKIFARQDKGLIFTEVSLTIPSSRRFSTGAFGLGIRF